MRKRLMTALVVVAVLALGSLAVFADYDDYEQYSHGITGPHYNHMVVRRGVGGPFGPTPPPQQGPGKGIPVDQLAAGNGRTIAGDHASPGSVGSTPIASATPEQLLENRLHSLSKELR